MIVSVIGIVAWRIAVVNGYVHCFCLFHSITPNMLGVLMPLDTYLTSSKFCHNIDENPSVRHGLGDTRPVVALTGILESDLIVICTSFPIIYPWLSSIVSARWNQNPDRSRSQSWTLRAIRTIGGAISKRGERAFDRLSSPDTVGGTYPLHSIHTTREWTVTERTLPEGQQPSNTDFGVSMDARTESNAAGEHRNWI